MPILIIAFRPSSMAPLFLRCTKDIKCFGEIRWRVRANEDIEFLVCQSCRRQIVSNKTHFRDACEKNKHGNKRNVLCDFFPSLYKRVFGRAGSSRGTYWILEIRKNGVMICLCFFFQFKWNCLRFPLRHGRCLCVFFPAKQNKVGRMKPFVLV